MLRRTTGSSRTLFSDEELAMLVHDLNNGLTVAQAGVEFVTDTNGELAPDTRNALDDAQLALERMRVMLRQFLDTYSLEEGGMAVHRTPAVLGDVVDRSLRVIGAVRAFELEVSAARELCRVDLGLVDRALANLLLNAVRYVREGGRVRVDARIDDGMVTIDVGNSGPAPSADVVPHLFEKFAIGERGERGLGLYLCKLVAQAHGGTVAFMPLAGLPANFRLRFPAYDG